MVYMTNNKALKLRSMSRHELHTSEGNDITFECIDLYMLEPDWYSQLLDWVQK